MNVNSPKNITRLTALVLALAVGQVALAQGVGNLGSLPTQFQTPIPPTGWTVTNSAGGPVPVVLDPTGPQWAKAFTGPNGGAFPYPPTSATNPPLPVTELLQVAGTNPWTDWHEDVLGVDLNGAPDPGWTWGPNTTLLVMPGGLPAPGLSITGVGTSNISFFFNPLNPGTVINIRKELVYNGVPGTTFIGTLAIHEYPTGVPEPASLGLLSLGGLAVFRRRGARVA